MPFHTIYSSITCILMLTFLTACVSNDRDPYAEYLGTPISYPFYERETAIGTDLKKDKFVIKTMSGPTEYTVELPDVADDYNVEVPVAQASPYAGAYSSAASRPKNPQLTDRELVANMPKLNPKSRADEMLADKMLSVASRGGPEQSPSYVLGIEKINQLYKQRNFEITLVEINQLLAYYPMSSQLYKMKGTVLIKLGNYKLAENSWIRASQIDPEDKSIRRGLEYLQKISPKHSPSPELTSVKNEILPPPSEKKSY